MNKSIVITMSVALFGFSGLTMAKPDGQGHERKGGDFRKKMMEKYDTDGDGKLSDDEKDAMKKAYKASHEAFKAEMIKEYDNDGDGELSDDERKEARESEKQNVLDMFDKDGNGELNGAEREKAGEWMLENRPFRLMHLLRGERGGKRGGPRMRRGEG